MKIFFFNELYLWLYLAFIFEGKFRILCQLNEVLVAVVVILLNNLKSFRKETFFQFFQTIWMEWCHWIQLSLYESLFFFLEGWGGEWVLFHEEIRFLMPTVCHGVGNTDPIEQSLSMKWTFDLLLLVQSRVHVCTVTQWFYTTALHKGHNSNDHEEITRVAKKMAKKS